MVAPRPDDCALSKIPPDWLADFEAAARRPLAQRMRYAFIKTYKPVLDDEPYRFRYLLLAQHNFLHRITAKMKSPIKVLRTLVERGIADGKIGIKDPALATAFAQGPLLFTAQSIVYRAVEPPLAKLADQIYAATMRAIGAPSVPPNPN